jgi:hypothetical protein
MLSAGPTICTGVNTYEDTPNFFSSLQCNPGPVMMCDTGAQNYTCLTQSDAQTMCQGPVTQFKDAVSCLSNAWQASDGSWQQINNNNLCSLSNSSDGTGLGDIDSGNGNVSGSGSNGDNNYGYGGNSNGYSYNNSYGYY